MTTQIAQFMVHLATIWDDHLTAAFGGHDLDATLANMDTEPSVRHLPVMSGGTGRADLERFYTTEFYPHLPDDIVRTRRSLTVDRFHLVDETAVSFTHDRELPWLLPQISPTHRKAAVLTITIVAFKAGKINSQRTLWDHATLLAQLKVPTTVEQDHESLTGSVQSSEQ